MVMFQTTRRRAQRTHTRLSWALGLVLLLLPAKVSVAAGPDIGGVTQREIALLQFYGGGTKLTGQERQEAADMVQLEMQRAPQAEIAADADAAKLLRVLARAPAPLIALAREGGRLNAQLHNAVDPALQQQQALEARIIAAHDPVVVFDPAHKRLVSEQTLRVLQSADAFGATVFDVPKPGADFIAQMRQIMPHAYSEMDDGMQDALAHAERDLPYAPVSCKASIRNSEPALHRSITPRSWRRPIPQVSSSISPRSWQWSA